MIHETIQNCLYELRTRAGVTQVDLSKAVGVTRQTIIAIEKGSYVPSVLLAMKLAKFFDTSVEKVFRVTRSS